MLNNRNMVFILLLPILIFFSSCDKNKDEDQCNECLELTTKSIEYINSNGANLLFGSQAIYSLDSLTIKTNNTDPISIWQNDPTIMFDLEGNSTSYYIYLSESLIDTLEFELSERKSEISRFRKILASSIRSTLSVI